MSSIVEEMEAKGKLWLEDLDCLVPQKATQTTN
jgi:hypothetical protein